MARLARTHTSLLGLLAVLLVVPIWLSARASDTDAASGTSKGPSTGKPAAAVHPIPTDFKLRLLRAGLDAESLAAAGVPAQSVLAALQASADVMNAAPSALAAADQGWAERRVAADALERRVRSGLATEEEASALIDARTGLEIAAAARASILDGYFAAATAALSAAQRERLTQLRLNRSWDLPPEDLVASRSEAQWVALRDALSYERTSAELGESPSQAAQTLLQSVRAEAAVAAARSAVQANLTSVTSAWNTAAGD